MNYEVYRKKDRTYSYCDDAVNLLPMEITSEPGWRHFRYEKVPIIGSIFETEKYKVTTIT